MTVAVVGLNHYGSGKNVIGSMGDRYVPEWTSANVCVYCDMMPIIEHSQQRRILIK